MNQHLIFFRFCVLFLLYILLLYISAIANITAEALANDVWNIYWDDGLPNKEEDRYITEEEEDDDEDEDDTNALFDDNVTLLRQPSSKYQLLKFYRDKLANETWVEKHGTKHKQFITPLIYTCIYR